MTSDVEGRAMLGSESLRLLREQQVSPLRFAPVEMTGKGSPVERTGKGSAAEERWRRG